MYHAQPLPRQVDVAALLHRENAVSAYDICLRFEEFVSTEQDTERIISARILGYLLLHPSSHGSLSEIVKEIHSCSEDYDALHNLGQAFLNYFIRAFRKYQGRTPFTSDHLSRPSFDQQRLLPKASIKEAPKNHSTAKAQALLRDGYRCAVTGAYDTLAQDMLNDELADPQVWLVDTECAHIVPESTYFNVNTDNSQEASSKKDYVASVLTVLSRFGYDVDKLNGPKVHSLYNVMTLEHNVHNRFDRLQLWLEETMEQDMANCYRVTAVRSGFTPMMRERVMFTTPDPERLPLPSPQLLALHAACAKVANLSGAADYLDKLDRELETTDVLACDGGAAEVLNHAIASLAGRGINAGA
ncbi:hypothetical protein GLOTRDRAFT_120712 [Gloeophyllum trabeum ATCC 11539]|uniref:HNH nuclease domain-containing protein n=1 Tax=Gloeophyllum trabeum (strain ATCC 11539 / FP-39264 / Madison 617) TaxID=670483 RepID=S7RSI1_GLOTA|nr:uncharacterized protein GLOTRDRAFT_120712 [Gloeophyllum trabeum ATCC 11539]EPQ57615.1 hypothetical protein GLOTRDRAFT_120712 [Gloeophyllum trabeum ATCC 11539]